MNVHGKNQYEKVVNDRLQKIDKTRREMEEKKMKERKEKEP